MMRSLLLLFLLVGSGSMAAATPADESRDDRRVALTFDDLPFIPRGKCDVQNVLEVNRRLLEALERQNAPATGLVVGGRHCGESEEMMRKVLRMWLDHGHDLGNHTQSHRDLNAVSLDWYLDDIVRTQEILDDISGGGEQTRWFRAPMLHMGDTLEKREGLGTFLSEKGYVVAPVTVDNQEWVFAAVYEGAVEAGNRDLAARVVSSYLEHLEDSFEYYEALSQELFGRQIPQVLLLHANRLNADHLDRVTAMLRRRGYDFISMKEAVRDQAYSHEDSYVGRRGLSWLQRWALTAGVEPPPEPREPSWLAELMRR